MPEKSLDKDIIRQILRTINKAWSKGNPDDLKEYFHEDLVILNPELQRMEEGKEACVQSYKEFMAQAVVNEYRERDCVIDVWGNTAVATYAFGIAYEMNGQTFQESGHDMFVFNREGERWLVVWRMVIPSPPNE